MTAQQNRLIAGALKPLVELGAIEPSHVQSILTSLRAGDVRPRMTIKEAAAYHGITGQTIRNWIEAGTLTQYKVGRKSVRLDRTEVEALAIPRKTTTPEVSNG